MLPLFTRTQLCLLVFTYVYTFNYGYPYLLVLTTDKVLSAEFYFHKPITVHLELYLFYCFIHFFIVHRSVLTAENLIKVKAQQVLKSSIGKPFIEYKF